MADATRGLNDLLGADRRTLAVPSSKEDVLKDQDLQVTISFLGAARGGWEERVPREKESSHPAWGETTGDLYLNDTAAALAVLDIVGVGPALDILDRTALGPRRPRLPLVAEIRDVPVSVLPRLLDLSIGHRILLGVSIGTGESAR